jgi:hypothetical protein
MEVLIPTHGNYSSAIESDEGQGQAALLPASTKYKTRDGRLVNCGMYAKSLRSLRKRSNGVGDDAPKFGTPQRETKNKETISDNDSNLHCSSKDDVNDNNANLLSSNAIDHDSDLLSIRPANDVNTELLTPSHEVWTYRLPFGGNHAAPRLLRERNKSPSLTLPNNDVQVPRLITCAQTAACEQGRFLKPVIVQFLDFTRDRIDKRENDMSTQRQETAIQLVNKGDHASTRDYASTRDRL